MPEDWVKKYKDLDTMDYVHHKKNAFAVPPCFLYLFDIVRVLSREPQQLHKTKEGERPAFGSFWLVHKDKNGNIHKTNLKAFMEKVDSGEIVFKEYMGKSDKANDWQRFLQPHQLIKKAIHHTTANNVFENSDTVGDQVRDVLSKPSKMSDAGSMVNARDLRRTGKQWGRSKAALHSAYVNVNEISYYNSEVDKRGYGFKIDPRTRGSTSSISRPMLQSAYSESRFVKTQSTFLNPRIAQSVVKFRIEKNPVVMRGTRSSAGFYVNRLPEREQEIPQETQPFIQIEEGQNQTIDKQPENAAQLEIEKDPFEEFENGQNEEIPQIDNIEEDLNNDPGTELVSVKEGVPVHFSHSNFRTTQNYFTNYKEKPENITYEPTIHTLRNSSLRQAMARTSSSKFFNSINKIKTNIFDNQIKNARSSAKLPTLTLTKKVDADQTTTMSRYNRMMMRTAVESTRALLSKRATRDSAREYEELTHAKARLSANYRHQSMESLKRALITPDTTMYQDITQMPIPSGGSRLLSFESQKPATNDKKNTKKNK